MTAPQGIAPCRCGGDIVGQWTEGVLVFPETCGACPPELIDCPDPENCEPYGDHYRRLQEGRCIRCGNWPQICGHNLPFKERMKDVRANFIGWSETR